MSSSTNSVVTSTFRQFFNSAVSYLLNPNVPTGISTDKGDTVEAVEAVDGPRRLHLSEAFDDEGIVNGNNGVDVDVVVNGAPQRALPRRRLVLQRDNTIISERYADEFVPPSSTDSDPASVNEDGNVPEGTPNGELTGNAAPAFVFGSSSSTSVNPALKRAGEHLFAVSQSMSDAQDGKSDSESESEMNDEIDNDSSENTGSDMDSDVDIDELDAYCASQGEKKEVEEAKDEEREEEERLKNDFPVVDVIDNQPYSRINKVLFLSPAIRTSIKRSRSIYEEEDDTSSASIPAHFSTPEDDLPPPTRYARLRRRIGERRRLDVERELVGPLYEVMKDSTDVFRADLFRVQEGPSDVRMAFLGRDGLDDAPTPPSTPERKRRRIL